MLGQFLKRKERGQFHTSIILAIHGQRIRGSKFKASPGQIVCITLSGKYPSQKRESKE
jgi:hypothetical protein